MKKLTLILLLFSIEGYSQLNLTELHPYPTVFNLRYLSMVDENNWFISGENNTFLKTSDGGESFTKYKLYLDTNKLYDISFINMNTGYVTGKRTDIYSGTKIFKTTNGGLNFHQVSNINFIYFPNSELKFFNEYNGIIFSEFEIFKTTNQGFNWTPIIFNSIKLGKTVRVKDNIIYIIGEDFNNHPKIFYSTNFGNSFDEISIPKESLNKKIIFVQKFLNKIHLLSGYNLKYNLYTSTDNGLTWSNKQIDYNIYNIYDGFFYNENNGIFRASLPDNSSVTPIFGLLTTTNNGNTWFFTPDKYRNINNLDIDYSGDVKIVVGQTGLIMKSKNNSNAFQEVSKRLTTQKINSISHQKNNNVVIAVGDSGTVMRSTNKGMNWTLQNLGIKRNLRNVFLFDDNIGYIVGDTGGIFKSSNSGANWQFFSLGVTGNNFYGTFKDSKSGAVIGGSEKRMHSTLNGGLNWMSVPLRSYYSHPIVGIISGELDIVNIGGRRYIGREYQVGNSGSNMHSFIYSSDAGANWNSITYTYNSFGISGYGSGDSDHVFLSYSDRLKYITFNNFQSYSVDTVPYKLYSCISFLNRNRGIAYQGGYINLTLNGGRNWYKLSEYFNYSMKMTTENDLFIFYQKGLIVHGGDIDTTVNINSEEILLNYNLYQNYPNPFNPETTIKFDILKGENIELKIYDITGRLVSTIVNKFLNPGKYEFKYNGNKLSSGIYFYILKGETFFESKKMVLLK